MKISQVLFFIINICFANCQNSSSKKMKPNMVEYSIEHILSKSYECGSLKLINSNDYFRTKYLNYSFSDLYILKFDSTTEYEGEKMRNITMMTKDESQKKNIYITDSHIIRCIIDTFYIKNFYEKKIEKHFFNNFGSLISVVNIDKKGKSKEEYKYEYMYHNNNMKREIRYWYGEINMTKEYLYDIYNNIKEIHINSICCQYNEPCPIDKIMIEYDSKNRKIKEYEIIDASIKKKYKNNFPIFNKVKLTEFFYDEQDNLIKKQLYSFEVYKNKFSSHEFLSIDEIIKNHIKNNCDSFVSYQYL